jgi:hypothetical protein
MDSAQRGRSLLSLRLSENGGEDAALRARYELTSADYLGNILGCRFLALLFDNRD